MIKYVFNEAYFRNPGWEDCRTTVDEKYEYLGNRLIQNAEQIKKKRLGQKRYFTEADYEQIKPLFPLLLLDTDLVVKKLIRRSNLDLSPNERLALYFMLDYLAAEDKTCRKTCVTAEELYKRINDKNMKMMKISSALDKLCEKGLCGKNEANEPDEQQDPSRLQKKKRLTKEELERKKKTEYSLNITELIRFVSE